MKIKVKKGYSNTVPEPGSIGAWTFIALVYTASGKTLWMCKCKCGLEKLCEPHSLNSNSMCKTCSDKNRAGKPRRPRKPVLLTREKNRQDIVKKEKSLFREDEFLVFKDNDPKIPAAVEKEAAQKTLSFISTATEDSPFMDAIKKAVGESTSKEPSFPKQELPRQEEKYPKCTMVPCACGNPLSFTVKYEPKKEDPKPIPQPSVVEIFSKPIVPPKPRETIPEVKPVTIGSKVVDKAQIMVYAKTSKKV
jgi:hypothetical protein